MFADRGFTGHEYLEDFKLYNMNGRLYDPVVGRFLNADPVVQDPGNTQSYNRYSYCLNNPLKYTDPSGEKWKWPKFEWSYLIPVIGQLDYVMQTINDNTEGVRQKMADAGIPDFQVGMNANLDGNVNFNASYKGQEVLNTENIDRSGPSVKATYKELAQVRQDYGQEWHGSSLYDPGEIRQYEPNIFERFSTSKIGRSIPGRIVYGVSDDLYVTATSFVLGHSNAFHLNGAGAIGNETVNSGINTLTNIVPIGNFGSFLGIGEKTLNAGQFNSLFKGTGITAAKDGGRNILLYNNSIRQSLNISSTWGVITQVSFIYGYYYSDN